MPVKSEAQRRAMEAAKHGHSTLGISREAATKFLADDSGAGYMPVKHAAGVVHVAPDGSILLLKRAGKEGVDNFVGHWALPGGGAEEGEAPIAAAHRETREETGFDGRGPMKLLDQVKTPNGMAFHTFVRPTRVFEPKLNAEHSDWAWVQPDELPEHTHPAVKNCLEKVPSGRALYDWATADEDLAQDSVHSACGGRGCAGCGGSGVSPITYAPMKPSLASDEATVLLDEIVRQYRDQLEPALAMDRAPEGVTLDRHGVVVTLAFDKTSESVRRTDNFERLHVKSSPITKAGVNPYYGREIPKAKELGLDPNRVYKLLRHPEELKKAAGTFNNLPLLSQHRPHTADDHDGDITVGTTGSSAEYVHPYLYNSLAVWSRDGIDHVETGDQKELSSAYGYDADMSPGVYEGEPYDGIMRNLVGNHVALVKKGRAGSDVVVGDEALQPIMERPMATKPIKFKNAKAAVSYRVVSAYLRSKLKLQPKIAMDAQINIAGALETIEAKKFKESVPDFLKAFENVLKKKPALIAQDGDLAGIVKGVQQLMTAVEGDKTVKEDEATVDPAEMEDPAVGGEAEVADDGGMEAVAAYLKEKGVPDDVIAGMPGMGGGAEDDGGDGPTDDMEKRLAGKKPGMDKDVVVPEDGPDGKKKPVTEGAMDAALQKVRKETIAEMNAVNEARAHVKPIVGEIAMAFDSAESVYQQAFTMIGNKEAAKVKGVGTLKTMWGMVPVPGARQQREQIAQDSDSATDFAKRFPNASRVRSAGGR